MPLNVPSVISSVALLPFSSAQPITRPLNSPPEISVSYQVCTAWLPAEIVPPLMASVLHVSPFMAMLPP